MASSVLIDELWIIKPDGTTILNERKDLTIDEQLFGGFLVAINSFLIEIGFIISCKKGLIEINKEYAFWGSCNDIM